MLRREICRPYARINEGTEIDVGQVWVMEYLVRHRWYHRQVRDCVPYQVVDRISTPITQEVR